MQIHHVSRILLCVHEPCLGGLEVFMKRQRMIQDSIEVICGIGMTLTEDASSMLSSQCLFIGEPSFLSQLTEWRLYYHSQESFAFSFFFLLTCDLCLSRHVHAEPAPKEFRLGDARFVSQTVRLADAVAWLRAGTGLGRTRRPLGESEVSGGVMAR